MNYKRVLISRACKFWITFWILTRKQTLSHFILTFRFDAFARIVDLGTQSLDDEKITELNKTMADTIDSSNRLNDDNVDDNDCGSEEDEDELDYWYVLTTVAINGPLVV